MIKGMYRSASGMIPRVNKQQIIANNIANVGTAGFKKDTMFTRELSKAEQKVIPKKTDWEQPMVDKVHVDYSPGIFDKTDNPLDLAIEGDGFFKLEASDGSVALTRSGTFQVDSAGFLAYPGGFRLSSESGPIQVGDGKVVISQTGEIEVDGSSVSRIVPVSVTDHDKLERLGGALFGVPKGVEVTPVTNTVIQQGYLETANVDVVREMVDMIITYRTYEANAKALQQQDASLDHLFQKVAR
ncbi:MAG: flagellar hook-basal body protein [candidate division Zixibacteria bacterium]|nr:flagellar hook-basal body protein [candidate division Zixibacteria bacterium]